MSVRILHVTQATGGVETSLLLLFRHLDRSRYELALACPPGTSLEQRARGLGVVVHPVPMVRGANPVKDMLGLRELTRLIRRERFDLVHGHSAKGGYLARLAVRRAGFGRSLYSPRAFSYLSQRGLARRLFLAMERRAVPWTDRLVACSESERTRAVREVGYPAERVVLVPNSVDPGEAPAAAAPAQTPVVLTVGRLSYQKNPEMFVAVARVVSRQRPDVRFIMAGSGFAGPLERRVRAAARSAGLGERLEFRTWADKEATLRMIAGCAVFVLTSRFEGMPNTVLEAMLTRRPVVVTDVDGSRDVVEDGVTGFVTPPDDAETMAARVLALLADPVAAGRMGAAAERSVRANYAIERNVLALQAVYDGLARDA